VLFFQLFDNGLTTNTGSSYAAGPGSLAGSRMECIPDSGSSSERGFKIVERVLEGEKKKKKRSHNAMKRGALSVLPLSSSSEKILEPPSTPKKRTTRSTLIV